MRRRPLAFRIALWAFVVFSMTILVISRTQPALAADLKTHKAQSQGSVATAGSGQSDKAAKSDRGNAAGSSVGGGETAAPAKPAPTPTSSPTPAPTATPVAPIAIARVAGRHATRVRLTALPFVDQVAGIGAAHAHAAGVAFRLEGAERAGVVTVTVGPRE